MKVTYANRTLERCASDLKRARKEWRPAGVAEAYIDRVPVLIAIDRLDRLYQFRGFGFHALHGKREGQYAISLVDGWRLIFQYYAVEEEIFIVEVVDYHD